MRLVYIEWADAAASAGWLSLSEVELETHIVKSVGYLIKENDMYVCLASTVSYPEFNNFIDIPKNIIIKMTDLVV